jgi:hypothetical protein
VRARFRCGRARRNLQPALQNRLPGVQGKKSSAPPPFLQAHCSLFDPQSKPHSRRAGNEAPPHAAQQAHLHPRGRRRSKRDASDGFFSFFLDAARRRIVGVDECCTSPQPLPPPGLGLSRRRPAVSGQVIRALRRLVRARETESGGNENRGEAGNSARDEQKARTSFENSPPRRLSPLFLHLEPSLPLPHSNQNNRTAFDLWSAFGLEVPLSLGGEGEVREGLEEGRKRQLCLSPALLLCFALAPSLARRSREPRRWAS